MILGLPHHVTQRGNNRQDVFFVDDDRRAYLELLRRATERFGAAVWGWCLMPNHVHLVVVPESEESLAKAIGRTHFHYTQYINRMHGRSGHLWQARFYSCPMDELHAMVAIRYLERNPVRAKLAPRAWEYEWSSAGAHVADEDDRRLLDLAAWRERMSPEVWRTELQHGDEEPGLCAVRLKTQTGRPLTTDRFLAKLESRLGRRLRPLPVGRPRKQKKQKRAAKEREKPKTRSRK